MIDNFENFKTTWDNEAMVVLDTNVLLRLYHLNPEATKESLEILRSMRKRIWLPHQVVREYHENHQKEHKKNFNKYTTFINSIRQSISKNKNSLEGEFLKHQEYKYPLLEELRGQINQSMSDIHASLKNYENSIEYDIEANKQMLHVDDVKNFVTGIMKDGATGDSYTLSEMISLFQEGEVRYKHLIPPGYKDIKKDEEDGTKQRKFGDLILWKQTLDQASKEGKDLIFVTNDTKEDWWEIDEKNKPIQARYELSKEFKEIVGKSLIMVRGVNFISYVSDLNHIKTRLALLDLASIDLCHEIFTKENWQHALIKSEGFQGYFHFNSELQSYLKTGYLAFGDVIEVLSEIPEFAVEGVGEREKFYIYGTFSTTVSVSLLVIESELDKTIIGECDITGTFSLEFDLEGTDLLDTTYVKNSVTFAFGGFEITEFIEILDELDHQ
ncbi:PIN-like domain-containing protein [Paenibacillus sp. 1A_MP2]|uniref:PIN-like domain-containing protein n=1 Tax=Paenibacillus sp. 1A_MP2 TaxID=3457495 RepID=UPI003FCC27DF